MVGSVRLVGIAAHPGGSAALSNVSIHRNPTESVMDQTALAEELRRAACQHALGMLTPEDMVALAERTVNAGHYAAAAAELAELLHNEKHPRRSDAEPLFVAWMVEVGFAIPPCEEAIWYLLRDVLGRVDRQELAALEGLRNVAVICESVLMRDNQSRYVGQGFGVTALYALAWAYDELATHPDKASFLGKSGVAGLAALSERVREVCRLWCKVHGLSPSLSASSPEASALLSTDVPLKIRP